MLKIKIFHFFALAIIGIGSTPGLQGEMQPRVLKGNRCYTDEFPYFVKIDKKQCGGSLLTYEWVLTAAHCLPPSLRFGPTVKVYSAFDMPSQLRQVRNAKEIHAHPNYVAKKLKSTIDFRYDIGLILVDKPFRQTEATRIATLPAPGFAKQCNEVTTIGAGRRYNNEGSENFHQRPLMCANLDIYNANSCKRDWANVYNKILFFDDTIMCMIHHQGNKGPCYGDSGGPVLCNNVVIGLVSMGARNCDLRTVPTTFTMVEEHLDFLDKFVKFTKKNVT